MNAPAAPFVVGTRRAGPSVGVRSAPPAMPPKVDVAIVGAGVIGLSAGWWLARRGLSVAVFDRGGAGEGTSLAATGMLAAAAEFEPGGEELLPLALESQRLWPQFRDRLEGEGGGSIDYRQTGTLLVALGRDELDRLRARQAFQQRAGLETRMLGPAEIRTLEPALRPGIAAGLFCPHDHQVDPVRLIAALTRAHAANGGHLFEQCDVTGLEVARGRVAGILTQRGRCQAGVVLLATGAWTGASPLLPPGIEVPVRPLKGQSLALRATPASGTLHHVVWTEQVHLAPKSDGTLIVGATMEECGFDPAVSAGGVFALLEAARRAFPSVEEMQLEAVWTGYRPTSLDDAPIIGACGLPGLLLATGHHRNGYLLAPVTAAAITELVTNGEMPAVARGFGLARFASAEPQILEAVPCN